MQAQTFTAGGSKFTIYYSRGKVVGKDKNFETRVSGGGGGASYQGTGGSAPISISSTTYIHDKIYLDIGNGKETAIELTDWDIACREGHDMMVVWIIKDNNQRGKYVAVKNFTTDNLQIDNNNVEQLAGEKSGLLLSLGCDAAIVVLLVIAGGLYWLGTNIGVGAYLIPIALVGLIIYNFNKKKLIKTNTTAIKNELNSFLQKNK